MDEEQVVPVLRNVHYLILVESSANVARISDLTA